MHNGTKDREPPPPVFLKPSSDCPLHEAIITETDSHFMTTPQLSVDTVSESVPNNRVPQEYTTVNINNQETVL